MLKSCTSVETVRLTFDELLDPLMVVPPAGNASTRRITSDEYQSLGPHAILAPNICVGPQDGWRLSVVNESSESYYLATTGTLGGRVGYLIDIPPGGSGVLEWGGWTGDMAAGAIQLLDRTSCEVLGTVEHPAWGTFVMAIDHGGDMRINPGPLPTDSVALKRAGFDCAPVRPTRAPERPCDIDITISGADVGHVTEVMRAYSN